MYKLSSKSLNRLNGVHPDLVKTVELAIGYSKQDFTVLEGLRSIERQKKLVAQGKSRTMNSRHLTGHAVDLAPWPISWEWPGFYLIADAMMKAANELNVPIRWGGNWGQLDLRKFKGNGETLAKLYDGNFPDGPHFELSREYYR